MASGTRGDSGPASYRRIRRKGTLIALALSIQAAVLVVGWVATFRVVRDQFAMAVERRVLEENAEAAERLLERLPTDTSGSEGGVVEFGTPEWEAQQQVVEELDLPGSGFACLLDEDGNILCHPDIRHDSSLRRVNLSGVDVEITRSGEGDDEGETYSINVGDVGAEWAIGRSYFFQDGIHYIATREIPETGQRLLVHQPQAGLLELTEGAEHVIRVTAALAALVVLGVTGLGLNSVIRRYDSFAEEANRKLEAAARLAGEIQAAALPASLPEVAGYSLAASFEAAEHAGGDVYDAVGLVRDGGVVRLADSDPHCVLLMLADATGHGVGPALAATQLRAMVRMGLRAGWDTREGLSALNAQLFEDLPDGRFLTAWFGVLDPETSTVRSFSAGQGPLLVARADGSIEEIETQSWPLAVSSELGGTEGCDVVLGPGDAFVISTDGIMEAPNVDGEQFGVDRLRDVLKQCHGGDAHEIIGAVNWAVAEWTGRAVMDDDRTVLVIKRG
ncbi:MAG: SpoIIE family protein phosphatase [Planctomycetota bacterium]